MARKRGRPRKDEEVFVPGIAEDGEEMEAMTPREWKFVNEYLADGDMVKAALSSGVYRPRGTERQKMKDREFRGYRPNAIAAARRVLTKHKIRIERIMDERGMSMVQLMTKLEEGLNAETALAVKSVNEGGTPRRGEGGKFMQELVTVPDHKVRVKYLEMGFKLRGAFPATPAVMKVQGSGEDGSVPMTLRVQHMDALKGKSPEELEKMLQEMILAQRRGPLKLVGT